MNNPLDVMDIAATAKALHHRFNELSFDQKRNLVSALLEIRVDRGYAARRVTVNHKVVTNLNADDVAESLTLAG